MVAAAFATDSVAFDARISAVAWPPRGRRPPLPFSARPQNGRGLTTPRPSTNIRATPIARPALPHCLIAGIVCSKPKSDLFPDHGLPRCTVDIRVGDTSGVSTWHVIGHDMRIPELEVLEVGDSVAIQSSLVLEQSRAKNGCKAITVTMSLPGKS